MLDVVANSQFFRMRASKKLVPWIECPSPRRPQHGDERRLRGAERNIDNEALELAVSNGREMICNGVNMPVVEVSLALDLRPCRFSECDQIA